MTENNLNSTIEALLFASEKPLTVEQVKKVLGNLGTDQIREALTELKAEYEQNSRGIRITEIAGGFQMTTSPDLAFFLKKLYKERRLERLSKPALETLAIIAYKQPLTKAEVQTLRNVNVDGVIKTLLDKDLIRISGRKKSPGRPHVFGTTRQFLEYFGLKSLEDLPKMEEFKQIAANQEKTITETEEIDATKKPAPTN